MQPLTPGRIQTRVAAVRAEHVVHAEPMSQRASPVSPSLITDHALLQCYINASYAMFPVFFMEIFVTKILLCVNGGLFSTRFGFENFIATFSKNIGSQGEMF